MSRAGLLIAAALLLASTAAGGAQWDTFHGDNRRTGRVDVNFPSADFQLLWKYQLSEHTYRYCKGASVWSASPIFGEAGGRTLLYIGAYDNNVYAFEPLTGTMAWRFTTGCVVNAALAYANVGGRPLVFAASTDRTFYCLDAANGSQLWAYETVPWSYTVGLSQAGSPLVAEVGGITQVFVTFWNTDRRPLRAAQSGEVFAFRADRRELLWRRQVTQGKLSAPAFLEVDRKPLLFIGCEDGTVRALDARSGKIVWEQVLGHAIIATPVAMELSGQPVVFVGDWWGMLNCLSARDGHVLWSYKTGHSINGAVAVGPVGGRPTVFVASFDRSVHAIDARSTEKRWQFRTRKYVCASPAMAKVQGRPALFIYSLDNNLYAVDAVNGKLLWRFETASMLWPYETRGVSLWSSPAVGEVEGQPLLVLGGHDGYLYAFTARAGSTAPDLTPARVRTIPRAALVVPPVIGSGLLLAGVALLWVKRKPGAA